VLLPERILARARKVPFPLLSDRTRRVCRKYRVIKRKVLYGKPFAGVERTTFVIDAAGVIRRVFRDVEPKGRLDEVLAAL